MKRGLYRITLILLCLLIGGETGYPEFALKKNKKADDKNAQFLELVKGMKKRYNGSDNPLITAFFITAQRYVEGFPGGMSDMDRIFLNSMKLSKTSGESIKAIVDNINNLPYEARKMIINEDGREAYQRMSLYKDYIFFAKNVSTDGARAYTDKEDSRIPVECNTTSNEPPPRIHRILPPRGIEPETWIVEPLSKVRIMGYNFKGKAGVFIHPLKIKHLVTYSPWVNVINDREMEFQIPGNITHLPDMYRIVIVNPGGTCSEEDDDLIEILPFRYSISMSGLNVPPYHIIYTISDGTNVYARDITAHETTLITGYRPRNGILYLRLTAFKKRTGMEDSIINMVLVFVSPIVPCLSLEWEAIERKPICAISGVETVSDLITLLNILSGNHYTGGVSEFYNVASLERLNGKHKKITISDIEIYLYYKSLLPAQSSP